MAFPLTYPLPFWARITVRLTSTSILASALNLSRGVIHSLKNLDKESGRGFNCCKLTETRRALLSSINLKESWKCKTYCPSSAMFENWHLTGIKEAVELACKVISSLFLVHQWLESRRNAGKVKKKRQD
jgi:hypothetical protein